MLYKTAKQGAKGAEVFPSKYTALSFFGVLYRQLALKRYVRNEDVCNSTAVEPIASIRIWFLFNF